ncbi:hypothetical protein U1Q18_021860 [Sarracenia purpurea var. burkii]
MQRRFGFDRKLQRYCGEFGCGGNKRVVLLQRFSEQLGLASSAARRFPCVKNSNSGGNSLVLEGIGVGFFLVDRSKQRSPAESFSGEVVGARKKIRFGFGSLWELSSEAQLGEHGKLGTDLEFQLNLELFWVIFGCGVLVHKRRSNLRKKCLQQK